MWGVTPIVSAGVHVTEPIKRRGAFAPSSLGPSPDLLKLSRRAPSVPQPFAWWMDVTVRASKGLARRTTATLFTGSA